MLFTDRNFAIIDKDGKKIGYARSVWAMINLNTRKPADLLTLHGGSIVNYVCDEPCPIEKPSRIKVTSDQSIATLTAKYSDIDINGHVNSIRYIEHILDLFPIVSFFNTSRAFSNGNSSRITTVSVVPPKFNCAIFFLFLVFDDLRHLLLIDFIFSHLFKYHFRAANNFVAILLHFYVKLVCIHFIAEEREFITKIAFRHIRHFKTTDTFGLIQFNREQIKDMFDVTDAVYGP